MNAITLDLAFARYGVERADRQRLLCATARDGSLVLVCQSSGFSRPAVGVLRYSATMSSIRASRLQVRHLREGIEGASAARTPIRLIVQTLRPDGRSNRVHSRADLTGSVTSFDGDSYSVDFMRIEVETPESPPPKRRKR